MDGAKRHSRGRPLIMLAALLVVWVSARAALWESPLSAIETGAQSMAQASAVPAYSNDGLAQDAIGTRREMVTERYGLLADAIAVPQTSAPAHEPLEILPPASSTELVQSIEVSGGHQLLMMAAMAHLPVPAEISRQLAPSGPVLSAPSGHASAKADRWSLEGWAFWRQGSSSLNPVTGRVPSYGASQAAAVLRYRLSPQDKRDPRAYLRAYRALVSSGETELALGLSARPVEKLPIRAHAEIRATERLDEVDMRPAAFITSEIAPVALPAKMRAEAYFQAGYVGGEDATPFADGQLHVLRDVKSFDLGEVSIGGGAWGGAQEGAKRLDLGPSLRLDLTINQIPARLSVDYRERVAGNAEPNSGASLTLSTRF